MSVTRCYFLLQTEPGAAEAVVANARTLTPVVWVDAITGSYDVVVHATGGRSELAETSARLRRCGGVERVLVCTPAEIRLEAVREPVPQ
jgi:hypothetical protein